MDEEDIKRRAGRFRQTQDSDGEAVQTRFDGAGGLATEEADLWSGRENPPSGSVGHVVIACVSAGGKWVAESKGSAAARLFVERNGDGDIVDDPVVVADDEEAQDLADMHGWQSLSKVASVTTDAEDIEAVQYDRKAECLSIPGETEPEMIIEVANRRGAFRKTGPSQTVSFVTESGNRIKELDELQAVIGSDEKMWLVPTITQTHVSLGRECIPPQKPEGESHEEGDSDEDSELMDLPWGETAQKPSKLVPPEKHSERRERVHESDEKWLPGEKRQIECENCGGQVSHVHVEGGDLEEIESNRFDPEDVDLEEGMDPLIYRCLRCRETISLHSL